MFHLGLFSIFIVGTKNLISPYSAMPAPSILSVYLGVEKCTKTEKSKSSHTPLYSVILVLYLLHCCFICALSSNSLNMHSTNIVGNVCTIHTARAESILVVKTGTTIHLRYIIYICICTYAHIMMLIERDKFICPLMTGQQFFFN